MTISMKKEEQKPQIEGGLERLKEELQAMGKMKAEEYKAVAIFVLVLFLWVMTGLVAAAFNLYAASLLLCRMAGVEDVRPIGALTVLLGMGSVLLFNFDSDGILAVVRMAYQQGYLLLLLPMALLWGRSLWERRRS